MKRGMEIGLKKPLLLLRMEPIGDLLADQGGVADSLLISDLLEKKEISADLFFEVWTGACYQENR